MKVTTRWRALVGTGLVSVFGLSASAEDLAVITDAETFVTNVTHDTELEGQWIISGIFRKTGSGVLTIPAEKVCFVGNGRLDVLDGRVDFSRTTGVADPIPADDIMSKAGFWFKADKNLVYDGNGNLIEWRDCREAEKAAVRQYIFGKSMTNLSHGSYPTVGTDGNRPYVYFGGFPSGQWMAWRMPADDKDAWIEGFNTFAVYNPAGSHGHIYGSNTNGLVDGVSHLMPFAVSTGGASTTLFNIQMSTDAATYGPVRTGSVYLNGKRKGVECPIATGEVMVLETEASGVSVPQAENFFNFKCYQANAGSYNNGNRVGGGRLHEVLFFTNHLNEAERLIVGAHLMRTWVDDRPRMPAVINVASKAALSLPQDYAGDCDIRVEGEVRVPDGFDVVSLGGIFTDQPGALGLSVGQSVTNRANMNVSVAMGRDYAVAANQRLSVSAGNPESVTKTGTGGIAFAGLEKEGAFVASGGSLAVRSPSPSYLPDVCSNVVADGGFELLSASGTGGVADGTSFGAWVSHPIESATAVRVLSPKQWSFMTGCIEGNYRLVLKGQGSVTQTVTLPSDGRYVISFYSSARKDYSGPISVYVDDVKLTCVPAADWDVERWSFYNVLTPFLTAGEHVLKLSNDFGNDRAVGIDDVKMNWYDGEIAAFIPNGNFEAVNFGEVGTAPPSSAKLKDVLFADGAWLSGWTVNDDSLVRVSRRQNEIEVDKKSNVAKRSYSALWSPFGWYTLLMTSGAEIGTAFTVPQTGYYRFSALLAIQGEGNPAYAVVPSVLKVSVNGKEEEISVSGYMLEKKSCSNLIRFDAGDSVTLKLSVGQPASGQYRIVLDEVTFALDREGNFLKNPSFAEGSTAGYTTDYWDAYIEGNRNPVFIRKDDNIQSFGASMIHGPEHLRIHGDTGYARQTVTLDEAGAYRFAFWARSRVCNGKVEYGPTDLDVELIHNADTNVIGHVAVSTVSTEFLKYEFDFSIDTPGDYTVGVRGVTAGDKSSFVDAFSLVKIELPVDGWRPFAEGTSVKLSTDADLRLDYLGRFEIGKFRYGGRAKSGEINALTLPGYVLGIGSLFVEPPGLILLIK